MTLFNEQLAATWPSVSFFINKEDYLFDAAINVGAKNVNKRGKNIITVEVPDTLRSNLSDLYNRCRDGR